MFEKIISIFFDKVKIEKKKKVLTLKGEDRTIEYKLPQKSKEEIKTSLSKYFCNVESLYSNPKQTSCLSSRKAPLQSLDSYLELDFH